MQALMALSGKLRVLGRGGARHDRLKFGRSENFKSLEEKFDSGWLSLHVLSIP
jgi:hypothetical protein